MVSVYMSGNFVWNFCFDENTIQPCILLRIRKVLWIQCLLNVCLSLVFTFHFALFLTTNEKGSMDEWMLNGFGCLENYAPFD